MTQRLAAALALAFALAPAARADQITLSGPTLPVTVTGGQVSQPFTVSITNNSDTDTAPNFFQAWQFNLTIQPDAGAAGTLTFNSPSGNPFFGATPPTNYVFAG